MIFGFDDVAVMILKANITRSNIALIVKNCFTGFCAIA